MAVGILIQANTDAPICGFCNERKAEKGNKTYRTKNGIAICGKCRQPEKYVTSGSSLKYRKDVSLTCKLCGFVAINKCQIDVDHILPFHIYNAPKNLRHICKNCHAYKTWNEKDTVSVESKLDTLYNTDRAEYNELIEYVRTQVKTLKGSKNDNERIAILKHANETK